MPIFMLVFRWALPLLTLSCASSGLAQGEDSELTIPEEPPSQQVLFGIGLGLVFADLPGAPGPLAQVSQSLYHVKLRLSFPYWDSLEGKYVSCRVSALVDNASAVGNSCSNPSSESLFEIETEVLYPATVKVSQGRASSLLRLFPNLRQDVVLSAFSDFAAEVSLKAGWALEKFQYGSTSLTLSSPRFSFDSRLMFRQWRVGAFIPGLAAGFSALGPFGRYSSNGDESSLEVDGSNVTTLASRFASGGGAYRWSVSMAALAWMPLGASPLQVSVVYELEKGRLIGLRKVIGYMKSADDGRISTNGFRLALERPF